MNLKNLILYSKNKSEEYLQYDLIYIKIDLFRLVNNASMLYRLSFLLKTSLFPGIFSLFVCISKLRERYV